MEPEKIISAGNKFAITFLVFFVFVFFVIIEPHFSRNLRYEQEIEKTLKQIEQAQLELQERAKNINQLRSEALLQANQIKQGEGRHAAFEKAEKEAQDAAFLVREKMVQMGTAHQALLKAKLEKKQYSIPLISISIDEDTLLKFFPILIALSLMRMFFYRLELLRLPSDASSIFPLWTAPIPFGKTSFRNWLGTNLAGFMVLGSIILLTLRFLVLYARENPTRLFLAAWSAVLMCICSLFFLALIALAMAGFPRTRIRTESGRFE